MAYHKPTHDAIEKLIEDHVKECRKNIPWDDENKVVVKKIIKIFKKIQYSYKALFLYLKCSIINLVH